MSNPPSPQAVATAGRPFAILAFWSLSIGLEPLQQKALAITLPVKITGKQGGEMLVPYYSPLIGLNWEK